MTDNIAVLSGYTVAAHASYLGQGLNLLIKPGTDVGECFRAWDTDTQEFVMVRGYIADISVETKEGAQ